MRRLVYLRDLLIELVLREMKLRYERSVLGVLWAVVHPLAQLSVFVIVFKFVFRIEIPNYPLYVFTGLLVWNWTRAGLLGSASAIIRSRELIRQPGFPLALLPVVSLVIPLIDMLIALPLVVLFVFLGGGEITFRVLALPLIIALHFMLLQGVGYLAAAAQTVFRDTGHLLGVILTLGFYLTPVFYDVGRVPDGLREFYNFNPMVHILAAYRSLIMLGPAPDKSTIFFLALLAVVTCVLGYRVFQRASYRFAEEL